MVAPNSLCSKEQIAHAPGELAGGRHLHIPLGPGLRRPYVAPVLRTTIVEPDLHSCPCWAAHVGRGMRAIKNVRST